MKTPKEQEQEKNQHGYAISGAIMQLYGVDLAAAITQVKSLEIAFGSDALGWVVDLMKEADNRLASPDERRGLMKGLLTAAAYTNRREAKP